MLRHPLLRQASIAAVCLIALSGCAPIAAVVGPSPILSPANQLEAAKKEYDFEAAYVVAGEAFVAAEPSLSPAAKAEGKAASAKLYAALLVLRAGEAAGDAAGLPAKIRAFQAVAAALYVAIGKTPPAAVVPAS